MVNHSSDQVFFLLNALFSWAFWILVILVVIYAVLEVSLLWHDDEIKWIKKKLQLLQALTKDYHKHLKEEGQLKLLGCDFWDSEDLSGIHLSLSKDETEKWVKGVENVVSDVNAFIAIYEKLAEFQCFSWLWVFARSQPIIEIILKMDEMKTKVENHLEMKDGPDEHIYDCMENSRSRNRSLLDRYESEGSQDTDKLEESQHQKHGKPSSKSIDELKKNKDLLAGTQVRWFIYLLLPLHAFIKDLSQLQLETETEKIWKSEAEKLIADAEKSIRNYVWWVSWLNRIPILKELILIVRRPIFRKKMQGIINAFDDLLKLKKNWRFKFIGRSAMKLVSPCQNAEDYAITSALESIRRNLSNQSSQQVREMYHKLEGMHKKLQDKGKTEVKEACLEQLEFIADEMDNFLSSFREMGIENAVHNRLEEIENVVDRLEKVIETCDIEIHGSTNSADSLKKAVRELVTKLTRGSGNPLTLSIVGMKGVGKEALAKEIYYNKHVVNHFPVRIWVTDGTASNPRVLQMKQDRVEEQRLPIGEVRDLLKRERGLIVLSNISDTKKFDKLRKDLLSETEVTNGSGILLTTRLKKVALHADKNSIPYYIQLLTKEESWALFKKVTSTVKSEAVKLERRVVARCGGLPLAISSVGFLMSLKGSMTEKDLGWVLDRINHGHNKTPWLQAWEHREEKLDETLFDCLYYLTLFPGDFEIPVRRIVNLWVAEGLVEQMKMSDDNQEKTSEYYAEKCLEELRDSNMIQVVERKFNGKIKTCRLPSTLREIILKDSNRTCYNQFSGTHLERRFAYRFDDRGLDANSANVFSKKRIPQSVFFFDKREGSKPGEYIGRILSTGLANEQFMEIRVLDLERVFRPQLPDALGKLIQVKYLGLRWTYLEEFPAFIGKLLNLETLDVKHTCIRVFPSSIWKLKTLYLNQDYCSRLEGKPRGNFQQNLYRLWGVFINGSCPLLCELQKLMNLRQLNLSFQLTAEERKTLAQKIVQLNQLESLRLRSVGEMGKAKELILGNMSKLEKLSSLQLYGKLKGGLCMNQLPKNLIHLTLSASELSDDPLPMLQHLHQLESLCFYADSYKGTRMVCKQDSFPKLQVLRFWKLTNLQKWEVETGALPNLEEFEARFCKELAVPTGLENLKNLRLIKLHEMPEPFKGGILEYNKTSQSDVNVVISP